jgi:hypothetical protein
MYPMEKKSDIQMNDDMEGVDATEDLPVNESGNLKEHDTSVIQPSKKKGVLKENEGPPSSILRHTSKASRVD